MKSSAKRLIDADLAAVRAFQSPHLTELDAKTIIDFLNQQETVDFTEVAHGRWVRHYYDSGKQIDDKWYCSECHMCNDRGRTWYCPDCGTKMDGDENARNI